MTKISLFAAVLTLAATGAAEAGGQAGSVGVGAEYLLSGTGGASVNYDGGAWHAGGALGYADPGQGDASWSLAGRFYYHVHSTAMADFGVGGSLGIASVPDGMGDKASLVYLEPGIQIRLFLASNVAVSAQTGIVFGLSDADGTSISGSAIGGGTVVVSGGGVVGLGGGLGLHYYFF